MCSASPDTSWKSIESFPSKCHRCVSPCLPFHLTLSSPCLSILSPTFCNCFGMIIIIIISLLRYFPSSCLVRVDTNHKFVEVYNVGGGGCVCVCVCGLEVFDLMNASTVCAGSTQRDRHTHTITSASLVPVLSSVCMSSCSFITL